MAADIQDIIKDLEDQLTTMVMGTKTYFGDNSLSEVHSRLTQDSSAFQTESLEDMKLKLYHYQDKINKQRQEMTLQSREIMTLKRNLKDLERENIALRNQVRVSDNLNISRMEKITKEIHGLMHRIELLEKENTMLREESIKSKKPLEIKNSEQQTSTIDENTQSSYEMLEAKLSAAENKIKQLENDFNVHNDQILALKKLYEAKSQEQLISKLDEIENEIERILAVQDRKHTSLTVITEEK